MWMTIMMKMIIITNLIKEIINYYDLVLWSGYRFTKMQSSVDAVDQYVNGSHVRQKYQLLDAWQTESESVINNTSAPTDCFNEKLTI